MCLSNSCIDILKMSITHYSSNNFFNMCEEFLILRDKRKKSPNLTILCILYLTYLRIPYLPHNFRNFTSRGIEIAAMILWNQWGYQSFILTSQNRSNNRANGIIISNIIQLIAKFNGWVPDNFVIELRIPRTS